jgi:hypothetical protein
MASDLTNMLQGLWHLTGADKSFEDYAQEAAQTASIRQQAALAAAQTQATQARNAQEAQFNGDWSDYQANPTMDKLATMAVKYPDRYQAVKEFWDSKKDDVRQSHINALSPIVSAIESGAPDLAIAGLTRLRDAAQKNEQPVDDLNAEIAALKSGDQASIKAVKGDLVMHLAAADQDGKFAESVARLKKAYEGEPYTLGEDQTRFSGDNQAVAHGPPKQFNPRDQYLEVHNGDQTTSWKPIPGTPAAALAAGGASSSAGGTGDGTFMGGIVPAEGGTNPDGSFRVSPKGAIGPSQLMPGTIPIAAKLAGVDPALVRTDTAANLAAGKAYHAKLLSDFGDPALAAAAYNAGPGVVQNALKRGGPDGWGKYLPAETKAYVPKVTGAPAPGSGVTVATSPTTGAPAPGGIISGKPADPSGDMSDDEINFYANKIAAGGDLPTLGMGKDAALLRRKILAKAADIAIDNHISAGQSNLLHADLKANTHNLSQLGAIQNQVGASERTASLNMDQVLNLAPQAVGGSVPVFNRWIQAGRKNITGDPVVSKFNVALNTVANEYAKVMTTNTGSGGQTSDAARNEAQSLINNAQTLQQLQDTIHQMRIDMANRSTALHSQRQILGGNISAGLSNLAPAGGGGPQPVKITGDADYARLPSGARFIGPDNQLRRKP